MFVLTTATGLRGAAGGTCEVAPRGHLPWPGPQSTSVGMRRERSTVRAGAAAMVSPPTQPPASLTCDLGGFDHGLLEEGLLVAEGDDAAGAAAVVGELQQLRGALGAGEAVLVLAGLHTVHHRRRHLLGRGALGWEFGFEPGSPRSSPRCPPLCSPRLQPLARGALQRPRRPRARRLRLRELLGLGHWPRSLLTGWGHEESPKSAPRGMGHGEAESRMALGTPGHLRVLRVLSPALQKGPFVPVTSSCSAAFPFIIFLSSFFCGERRAVRGSGGEGRGLRTPQGGHPPWHLPRPICASSS